MAQLSPFPPILSLTALCLFTTTVTASGYSSCPGPTPNDAHRTRAWELFVSAICSIITEPTQWLVAYLFRKCWGETELQRKRKEWKVCKAQLEWRKPNYNTTRPNYNRRKPNYNTTRPNYNRRKGLRAASKALRKEARTKAGYSVRRVEWDRHALSAYNWLWTNRGPQNSWLHHIGKAESAECACGHPSETGEHVVFACPRFDRFRRGLLGEKRSWEELDKPEWRKEGEESYEAT